MTFQWKLPQPLAQDVSWVNVVYGSDTTGTRNDPSRPFKTLNGAFAAAPVGSQDTFFILPTGNTGAVNSVTSGDLTLDKPCQVVQQMGGPDTAPAILNSTITLTNTTRGNLYFDNVTFFNTVDKLNVNVQMVSDHAVTFNRCYFYNGAGTNNMIQTSGTWTHNVSLGSRLIFNNCTFGGIFTHGAGTPGSPYDLKGMLEIRNHHKNLVATNLTQLIINSGSALISDANSLFPITLNGGALEIINSRDIYGLYSDGYLIKANNVASPGISFLTLRNFNCVSFPTGPLGVMPKIKIGANVIYRLVNVDIPIALLEIDAAAIELSAWLVGQSKSEIITFNSGKVYGIGSLLT
jgi:hypothetical protein